MVKLNKAVHLAGIVGGFVAAVVAVIAGLLLKKPAIVIWGVVFAVGAVVGLVSGAKASPRGGFNPPQAGANYTEVPDWAWFVVAGAFVVGIVFTFVFPPWN
jgi:hypothetical protein